MGARLVDLNVGPMAATLIKYDESGQPMYADDLRLGNRKQRRNLLREQRRLMADVRT